MPAGQAVEELISKYSKLVFHTIYAITGDWEESQDLTQDTFHQALKGINAARTASGSEFREKAWLIRIALNTARMQRRRRNLFRFIPFSHMQKGKRAGQAYETEMNELNTLLTSDDYREHFDEADNLPERERKTCGSHTISAFGTHPR